MKKINKVATNTAIALCAIVGVILVGAIAYSMIQNNEQETEEITPPDYIPVDTLSVEVDKHNLLHHNLSVKLIIQQQDENVTVVDPTIHTMVSELYRGNWTNISLRTQSINLTSSCDCNEMERAIYNITTVPDGYHRISFYITYENALGKTLGAEQSFTIESVLGHERSWQVVDEWP